MARQEERLTATRTSLLARLKDWRDDLSWQRFFDTYWHPIYGVARARGLTETEAQDLVQEVMVSVAKHMPRFQYDRSVGSFRSWLLNLVRWRIVDQMRRRVCSTPKSDPEATSATELVPDSEAEFGLKILWDKEWKKNVVEVALKRVRRQIDPKRYQVFDFYVNKNWPVEKVAKTFGIKTDQVYLAKHRITSLIKKEVARMEAEIH